MFVKCRHNSCCCGAVLTSGPSFRGAISLAMCSAAADLATRNAPAEKHTQAARRPAQISNSKAALLGAVCTHYYACLNDGYVAGAVMVGDGLTHYHMN
jgi:hypothetical protein